MIDILISMWGAVARRRADPAAVPFRPSAEMRESGLLRLVHTASSIAIAASAVGSLGFMLYAGRRNRSWLLLAAFAIWVGSPFVGFAFARARSRHWPAVTRAAISLIALVLAVASVAIYGTVALGPPRAQAAFVFVVVPPASWMILATVVAIAAFISRRNTASR